mmetsp:Transcript_18249/g.64662  ORF Transcript_18249/g.64662 Transcript_18249/m.64662 type:complete len:284 (-) Transcript_18249:1818-2669(-)
MVPVPLCTTPSRSSSSAHKRRITRPAVRPVVSLRHECTYGSTFSLRIRSATQPTTCAFIRRGAVSTRSSSASTPSSATKRASERLLPTTASHTPATTHGTSSGRETLSSGSYRSHRRSDVMPPAFRNRVWLSSWPPEHAAASTPKTASSTSATEIPDGAAFAVPTGASSPTSSVPPPNAAVPPAPPIVVPAVGVRSVLPISTTISSTPPQEPNVSCNPSSGSGSTRCRRRSARYKRSTSSSPSSSGIPSASTAPSASPDSGPASVDASAPTATVRKSECLRTC